MLAKDSTGGTITNNIYEDDVKSSNGLKDMTFTKYSYAFVGKSLDATGFDVEVVDDTDVVSAPGAFHDIAVKITVPRNEDANLQLATAKMSVSLADNPLKM